MKLSKYIQDNFNGNISEYARVNNYHITQVRRFIEQGAEFNSGEPYFKKWLKEKSNVESI